MEKGKKYNCLLLEVTAKNWMTDTLFAVPDLDFFALPPGLLGKNDLPNPYQLNPIDKPDFIFISTNCYHWLKREGDDVVKNTFNKLRKLCDKIVGIEGYDTFGLGFPPEGFQYIDMLLKAQGVYKDKELYNYKVGSFYPGVNWTEKTEKLEKPYTPEQLDKIKLSFPCFLGVDKRIRQIVRKSRKFKAHDRLLRNAGDIFFEKTSAFNRVIHAPEKTLHFIGAMTHFQRMEIALDLKKKEVNGMIGITNIPSHIWGTPYLNRELPEDILKSYQKELQENGLLINKMNRNKFKASILRHKAVLAPCGYGELSFRMAEAWELGRLVVCQDLSHVNTLFPFKNGHNVVFCRPDFSDLEEKIVAIENQKIDFKSIGLQGEKDWTAWVNGYQDVLKTGVTDYLNKL